MSNQIRMKRRMQIIMLRTRARLKGVDLSGLSDAELDRKMTMFEIRSGFEFFGVDTAGLTDQELSERVVEGARLVVRVGITAEEAAGAMRDMMLLLRTGA